MLFNCLNCGHTISSKKDICVYCKTSVSQFVAEFNKDRQFVNIASIKEKYAGTFMSFLLKAKTKTFIK